MNDQQIEIREFVNSNMMQIRGAALATVEYLKDQVANARPADEKALANFVQTQITGVLDEAITRFVERVVYVPFEDEPTFILLARDPQAPALVERWATERNVYEPEEKDKINRATETAGKMREWKEANPEEGMSVTKMDPSAQLGYKEVKDDDGYVTLTSVFAMPGFNKKMTLLRIYKSEDASKPDYLMHAMDGATGMGVVGFLTREDLLQFKHALKREFP